MQLEKGDFVKYRIMADDEHGNPTNEILEEGEAQILDIYSKGTLVLDTESGLAAWPHECEKIKPKVRGNWVVHCDIECPKCGHDNDLMDVDEWYLLSKPGENKEFDKPEEFKCQKCGFEMLIEGTDY